MHDIRNLKSKQLDRIQPSLNSLTTPVLFLLWQVQMSPTVKLTTDLSCYCVVFNFRSLSPFFCIRILRNMISDCTWNSQTPPNFLCNKGFQAFWALTTCKPPNMTTRCSKWEQQHGFKISWLQSVSIWKQFFSKWILQSHTVAKQKVQLTLQLGPWSWEGGGFSSVINKLTVQYRRRGED